MGHRKKLGLSVIMKKKRKVAIKGGIIAIWAIGVKTLRKSVMGVVWGDVEKTHKRRFYGFQKKTAKKVLFAWAVSKKVALEASLAHASI